MLLAFRGLKLGMLLNPTVPREAPTLKSYQGGNKSMESFKQQ